MDLSSTMEFVLTQLSEIAQGLNQQAHLDDILNYGVREARTLLASDRALIYQFLPGGDGVISAEAVATGWSPVIGQLVYDACLQETWAEPYRHGRIRSVDDVEHSDLAACHIEFLTRLQVKANLVVPILLRPTLDCAEPELWGLLIVHQCSGPRRWQPLHGQMLRQVATLMGFALQRWQLHQRLQGPPEPRNTSNAATLTALSGEAIGTPPGTALGGTPLALPHQALMACANAVIITDRRGTIAWANPAFSTLTGYSPAEVIGKNPRELVKSGRQDANVYHHLWQEITQGRVWRGQLVNRRKDGSLYREAMTISPIRNHQGQIQHFVAIKQDVTDCYQGQQHLRDSREMLRKISQQVPGVVYQYRRYADGRACFPYASEAIRQIYEVTPEQVKTSDQLVMERIHPLDLTRVVASIQHSCRHLELWHDECRVILPRRGVRWLEGHAMPEALEDGSVLWHGYIWDITARKALELSRKQRESLYRGLFDQAIVGISLVGKSQKILRANQRFCRLLGYTEAELRKMSFLDVIHPEDIPRCLTYLQATLRSQTPGIGSDWGSIDHRYRCKNGQVGWVTLSISPIYSDAGELQYSFGVIVDISERKTAELLLHQEFQRERMIHLIDHHIRQSLDLRHILQTAVNEVRQFLQTDRVIIYQLEANWHGVVLAESVDNGWLRILNQQITDSYFVETQGNSYHDNRPHAIPDIYNANFSDCHLELLEWLQVRAKLVVPILQEDRLWGLLIAHHCQGPRQWLPAESRLLQQLAGRLAIAIQQSELHQQLQSTNQLLERLSNTDGLTQVANRRRFDAVLVHEWQRSRRTQQPLALILCDIDYFKLYNDTYGHPQGDICLTRVAGALKQCLKRSVDCIARYGGEEFAAILPNTDLAGAVAMVQTMQQAIADLRLEHRANPSGNIVTLSFGIAAMDAHYPAAAESTLLERADQALYRAKQAGRNGYAIN
jgi:diguanylate cyclase (GGDEF)-like protein/PAS domain S-box-containing protein